MPMSVWLWVTQRLICKVWTVLWLQVRAGMTITPVNVTGLVFSVFLKLFPNTEEKTHASRSWSKPYHHSKRFCKVLRLEKKFKHTKQNNPAQSTNKNHTNLDCIVQSAYCIVCYNI